MASGILFAPEGDSGRHGPPRPAPPPAGDALAGRPALRCSSKIVTGPQKHTSEITRGTICIAIHHTVGCLSTARCSLASEPQCGAISSRRHNLLILVKVRDTLDIKRLVQIGLAGREALQSSSSSSKSMRQGRVTGRSLSPSRGSLLNSSPRCLFFPKPL